MSIVREERLEEILGSIKEVYNPPIFKANYSKGIDSLKLERVSDFERIYQAIDWYYNSSAFESIPKVLIENDFLVKNIIVRYFKNPYYWISMNKLNDERTMEIYNISVSELLKYSKSIVMKYNIDPNRDKLYIKKQFTRINNDGSRSTIQAKLGVDIDDPVFKEFKKNFQERSKQKYPDKELIFLYTSILTDEELSSYTTEHKKLFDKDTRSRKKDLLKAHNEAIKYRKNNPNATYSEPIPQQNIPVTEVSEHKSVTSRVDREINSNEIDTSKRGSFEYMIFGGYKTDEGNFADHNSKLLRKSFINVFSNSTTVAYSAIFPNKEDLKNTEIYPKVVTAIANAIDLYRPKAIILTDDLLLDLFTNEYNSSMTVYNSRNKVFSWKYDENFDQGYFPTVFAVPSPHKLGNQTDQEKELLYSESLQYIYSFIKQGNVNEAIIKSNQVDHSHLANEIFEKMNDWNQVIDMFKQGYQLGLVQSFYHETLFKDPLLLVQFKKDSEKIYFDCTDIAYVYYYCAKKVDIDKNIGIDPIETGEFMVEKSISMREFITSPWGIGKKADKARHFESDLLAVDKFTIYAKTLAMKHELDFENILAPKFDMMYLDIEVYSPDGFPKPEYAKGEVTSFAYMNSMEDLVTIVINAKGENVSDKANELINKFLSESNISLKKGETINLKDLITFEVIEVQSEYNIYVELEKLIQRDKCEIGTAWNAQFDFNYLINRAKLMKWDDISLSPFKIRGYNSHTDSLYRPVGMHNEDMLDIYKNAQRRKPKSLKLGYIANNVLGITKLDYDGELWELYDNNKPLFAAYNIFDTILIKYINIKSNLFDQILSLRQFQGSSLTSMNQTLAPFTCLSIRKARQDGVYLRRVLKFERKTDQYEGAFTMTRSTLRRPKFVEGELTSRGSTSPLRFGVTDFDQSLTYDQKILINRNDKESIIKIGEYKFEPGDQVLTIDTKNNTSVFANVKGKLVHKRKAPIYKIKLKDGSYIEGTAGHTAIVFRNGVETQCRMDEILSTDKFMTISFDL